MFQTASPTRPSENQAKHMKPLDLNFICQALQLPMPSENGAVKRIVTDSRDIQRGDGFFALAGERVDAHDFVADVLAKGALAAVVSREDCAASAPLANTSATKSCASKRSPASAKNTSPL